MKVFCRECKYHIFTNRHKCTCDCLCKDNPIWKGGGLGDCIKINKNNNCKYFERPLGFWEKIFGRKKCL
jgi:hypothetical protein